MREFLQAGLTIAGGIGALILVYLLFAHPTAVIGEIGVGKDFVIGETKTLQGR